MADIPAANITNKGYFTLTNVKGWKCKVKGDGTGVTITTPFSRVDSYWTQSIDDTTIPAPSITESGGVLTYATTPTINTYHWLFVLGY